MLEYKAKKYIFELEKECNMATLILFILLRLQDKFPSI